MKKKIVILGAIFAALLMLITPAVSSINVNIVEEEIEKDDCSICSTSGNPFLCFISFEAYVIGFALCLTIIGIPLGFGIMNAAIDMGKNNHCLWSEIFL